MGDQTSLSVADLDDDGCPDIVTVNGFSAVTAVLLSNGDRTFEPAATYSAGTSRLVLADITGDGSQDVITTTSESGICFLPSEGRGEFGNAVVPDLSSEISGVLSAGDFNSDGKVDLVAMPSWHGEATILLNLGGGDFLEYMCRVCDATRWGEASAVADFNGDGKDDVVLFDGESHVFLGSGRIPFAARFVLNEGAALSGSLTLSIDSEATGVAEMRFHDGTNWTEWQPYSAHVALTLPAGDGERSVGAQYRDASGEVISFSDDIVVDTTPPRISYVYTSDWCKEFTEVRVFSSDPLSGVTTGLAKIEYRLDDHGWQATSQRSHLQVRCFGNGVHSFQIRCTDALGSQSEVVSLSLRIDSAAPVTTQSGADSSWHNHDVVVSFHSVDAGIGVQNTQYSVDGGATWADGNTATVHAAPTDPTDHTQVGGAGVHNIYYRSTDFFGHVEATKTCSVKINTTDVTPPVVSQTGADGAWHKRAVTVHFAATDVETGVSSIEYSIGGGGWTSASQATISAEGATVLRFRAIDDLGNVSPSSVCRVEIDTHRPTPLAGYKSTVIRGRRATLRYEVKDPIPGSPTAVATIKIFSSHHKLTKTMKLRRVRVNAHLTHRFTCALARGAYRFYVYATDSAGNTQTKVAVNSLVVK